MYALYVTGVHAAQVPIVRRNHYYVKEIYCQQTRSVNESWKKELLILPGLVLCHVEPVIMFDHSGGCLLEPLCDTNSPFLSVSLPPLQCATFFPPLTSSVGNPG